MKIIPPLCLRTARALVLALTCALPVSAAAQTTTCHGRDLIADLPAADRGALDAAVAAVPYPAGNHWRATRGAQTIDVIGTFHLYDPRMDGPMARLAPLIAKADRVYLEATDVEIAQLKQAVATRPELLILRGKTLPERLPEADWQKLSAALQARGVPAFMGAKFQPWYVAMLLGMPPCAMSAMTDGATGMDHLISEAAKADGVPMAALEPYDTAIQAISGLTDSDQTAMIRDALLTEHQSEDLLATMTAAYFRQDHRTIWEFARQLALKAPGAGPAKVDADLTRMEDLLVIRRNQAWVALLDKAKGDHLIVAVGAGHLAGQQGLLQLLQQAGFKLAPAEF
jgi:uncharacterized protein YbaP (TraB family)